MAEKKESINENISDEELESAAGGIADEERGMQELTKEQMKAIGGGVVANGLITRVLPNPG